MKTKIFRCKVTNAAVDWVTVTAATKGSRERLWRHGERLLNTGECEGERTTRWHAHGYRGWQQRHCAMGSREDGCYLRLSGLQAANEWREAIRASENCSRLDLAVDCESKNPVTTLAAEVYHDASHVPPVNGRPPKRSLIQSSDGGSTVYIGARASEQYGRIYDKGRETATRPAGCWWRWEVELKGDASRSLASSLLSIDHETTLMCATVATWFRRRTLHTFTTSTVSLTCSGSREPTAIDAQLTWLSRGVRPTVRRLVDVVGVDRVLFALGLPPQSAVSPVGHHNSLKEA